MQKSILILFLLLSFRTLSQPLYFPPTTGTTWDTLSLTSLGWCQDKMDTLLDYLGNRNTKAFILLKDGKIVVEQYYGTFTADSIWYWASAGKSLTSFMVGLAQQDGHLSISDTSSQYMGAGWTSCPPLKEDMITIRHQLTMTTGLDDGVPDDHCTLDTCLQYLADAGTRWAYHNAPYTLLDSVLESATGQTLNAYVFQKLYAATGIAGLYLPSSYDNVFYSKPRNMARFGLLMLNHGNWNGNQILTDTNYYSQMVNTSQSLNLSYGYLWWLNGKASYMVPGLQLVIPGFLNPNAPADMFAAMGKNGQFINVVPSMNLVYIRMGDAPGSNPVPFTINDTIWLKLNDVFCNATAIHPVDPGKSLSIFPNPAHKIFTVDFPGHSYDLILFDALGKIVFIRNSVHEKTELNTSNIKPGVYFLRVQTNKESVTTKISIQ